MNEQFKKRTYESFGEFLGNLRFLLSNVKNINRIRLISPDFRERFMLAVTAVYGCRYCSYFHTREASRSGIERGEMASILSGTVGNCPEEEATAEPESIQRLVEMYGSEKAEAINLLLRMSRVGNLLGNPLDYLLHTISFGRWKEG